MTGVSFGGPIENRLAALIELSRREKAVAEKAEGSRPHPTITISREFGCEGMLVAEKTQALLKQLTGDDYAIMDRGVVEKVNNDPDLSNEILGNLGEKNLFMDGVISTIFNKATDKEQFQQFCKQILPFAKRGKIIMVGAGAGIIVQNLPNSHNFRIIAPLDFKVKGVARRHQMSEQEAGKLIDKRQKQRNTFIKDLLGKDLGDASLYDVIFNNANNTAQQIAEQICHRVLSVSAA